MTSFRWKLAYQMPLFISLRSGIKSQEESCNFLLDFLWENDMATVSTNIRIDENVKAEASKLFEGLGLTLSDAVNVFLRQSILHRGVPFKIEYPEEKPNRATIRAMKEGDRFLAKYAKNPEKYKKNPKKYGLYNNVEEALAELKK